jgi:cyclopropane-fatty-acyl-phospholipid synthase
LGAVGPRPPLPPEEVRQSRRRRGRGVKHSPERDAGSVRHHYDVGNDFYRLVLGPSLVYSCAYWAQPAGLGYGLEQAQRDKLELICRKLGLQPGMRVLDVGCGWGSLALHAARYHGVRVLGVTLSGEQASLARHRVAQAGLSERVEIRVQDYREVGDGLYDAIASVGMSEHVGAGQFDGYCQALFALLRPGGRLLNHAIACPPSGAEDSVEPRPSFMDRYVFPDGEVLPLGMVVDGLERAGFEVRDTQNLREHYAQTLRAWVDNLDSNWAAAVDYTSEGRARVWKIYMVGAALAFPSGQISVNQVLAIKRDAEGASHMAPTRDHWILPDAG